MVGKGHVRGILYTLTTPNSSGVRFRDLVGSRNVKTEEFKIQRRQKLASRITFEVALAAVAYFAWEAFKSRTQG